MRQTLNSGNIYTLAGARLSSGKATSLPRMADFATWGYAIMEALAVTAFLQATRTCRCSRGGSKTILLAQQSQFMTDKDEWKNSN